MARHFEKDIERAQGATASVGKAPERTDPRTRAEIESFVKGFALSESAVRQIVDEWEADAKRARDEGYDTAEWDASIGD